MAEARFQEANAEEFDQSLISQQITESKREVLQRLTAKLHALTHEAQEGKPVSEAIIEKLKAKISAYECEKPMHTVDLPSGLDIYSTVPVDSMPSSTEKVELKGGIGVPDSIWQRLFEHQKQALGWLADLHIQNQGGILADEMGLGKTVEIASFFTALRDSGLLFGPILVLCPATIISHWKDTLYAWGETHVDVFDSESKRKTVTSTKRTNGVLITNYEMLYTHESVLRSIDWFYVVLDEGHKIRNPVSKVTMICKRLRGPHRLLLSGTPIQNNLTEFWSLVDFVNPGLLGSLETFDKEIAGPILKAGYVTANVETAELGYQCACQLRDLIAPIILRRTKKELKLSLGLPEKEEKLLLCDMTQEQYECYVKYLDKYTTSIECKKDCFACIRDLRHITNHPCILAGWKQQELAFTPQYSDYRLSGKMLVFKELLESWALEAHKTAVFSQSKKMLTVCESLVQEMRLPYARIDGDMSVALRLPIIEAFNHTSQYRVLLLTTKVGGLGVSLTGASRLVLLDPDWNPMTDIQAKERALRIGQNKNVGVYRFIARGTIEEKVYRRQVFKVFLANRILHHPEQKKFFSTQDINELFEYPPQPKRLSDFHEEDAPSKRPKLDDNQILSSLLDSDGVKREDLSQSLMAHPANIVEMKRIEIHAKQLAQKAAANLLKSRRIPLTAGLITHQQKQRNVRFGTGQAEGILQKVREGKCAKVEKQKLEPGSEELAMKRFCEFFKGKKGTATSAEIVTFANLRLYGFDPYIVKAVLRAVATLDSGKWTLKSKFAD